MPDKHIFSHAHIHTQTLARAHTNTHTHTLPYKAKRVFFDKKLKIINFLVYT